ncbi:hypothetical protein [Duganella sp. P38]|uniref:hypothetical protein n=1 Tax=Duganella sp. P38 TaxID=3423949 RepID=UPI003D7A47D5
MFPISSLTPSAATELQPVNRAAEAAAVNSATINAVGSALDAPPAASVQVDLSPVASFLLTVTNAQQQLAQAQGTQAQRADSVNAAVQNVVDAFNLLPTVDFDQGQPLEASLLNNLVNSLNQQNNDGANTQAQNLARLGLTLQPPLLSDLTGGLSLEPELLRAAFGANDRQTTDTLQNTLNSFRDQATQFAERLAAAGSSQIPGLNPFQQPALTPADLAANARLSLARAEIDNLSQNPLPETAADRLAAQRAELEQPTNAQQPQTPSPIVNQQLTAQQQAQQALDAQAAADQQAQATLQANAQQALNAQATQQVNAQLQANQLAAGQAQQAQTPQQALQAQAAQQAQATQQGQQAQAAQQAQQAQQANQLNAAQRRSSKHNRRSKFSRRPSSYKERNWRRPIRPPTHSARSCCKPPPSKPT